MKSQGDIDIKFNPRLLKLCKNRPIFFQNSQTCRSRQIFIFKNPGRIDTKLNSGDLNFSLQNESRYRLEKWCAFVEMLFLHKKKFTNICDYRERYIKFKKNSINSTHDQFHTFKIFTWNRKKIFTQNSKHISPSFTKIPWIFFKIHKLAEAAKSSRKWIRGVMTQHLISVILFFHYKTNRDIDVKIICSI